MNPDILLRWPVQQYPEHVAVVSGGERCSFREMDRGINRLAWGLCGLGLARGARIAVLMGNRPAFQQVVFAVGRAGLALVALNVRQSPAEHARILEDAGVEALIFDRRFAEVVQGMRQLAPPPGRCFVAGGEVPGAEALEALAAGRPAAPPEVEVGEEDLARIHYTSGTSGRPKGVVITHGQNYHRLAHVLINLDQPLGPETRNLNVGPLTHAAGLMFTVYYIRGATNIILERFDPEAVLRAIEAERITDVLLVPTMLGALLRHPAIDRYDTQSLRRIWYGTAPMPAGQLREGLRRFGPVFRQNYGMSEASQPLTILGPEDHVVEGPERIVRRLRSAGRPALGMDLKVVDEAFAPVPPGQVGEIVYRSRHMFREYWKLPEETARAFRDGWFLTGDLGTVDEEGYVYIVGRKDDLIISGGFNIQPREVEEAILKHPAVAEVAVVGVPDERWGEAVKAVCVLRPGMQAGPDEIVAACRRELAGYKKPRIVEVVAELPKNEAGKVERKKLRGIQGGTEHAQA